MSNLIQEMSKKGVISGHPQWMPLNTMYLTVMGSVAYGVSEDRSDMDIYGITIPPKDFIFPQGHIRGFGPEPPSFENWQKHHIDYNHKNYDINLYGIVNYFELCRGNNPNMVDSLFTNEENVIHCTNLGRMIRDNRRMFLSKLCWKKMRGYAMSQIHKAEAKMKDPLLAKVLSFEKENGIPHATKFVDIGKISIPPEEFYYYVNIYEEGINKSKRFEERKTKGQDTKFLYHIIRLYDEAEQILTEGDLDLTRAKETMKSVRRGEWSIKQVRDWMIEKDKNLETACSNSKLPERPPIEPIKKLLLNCLEEHYGSLKDVFTEKQWAEQALVELDRVLEPYRSRLYS